MTPAPAPARARARSRRPGAPAVVSALLLLLCALIAGVHSAAAAGDYTQSAEPAGAGLVRFRFVPVAPSALVDVHYLVNGAGQQNFRMDNAAGTWTKTTAPLPEGARLDYWFTYEKNGPLYDTPHFAHTVGGGTTPTPSPTVPPPSGGNGAFPIVFRNDTRGTWSDAQIYVTVLGQVVPGQWSYLRPDGTTARINHLDAAAPGHLVKNGVNYPNMSFTLARAATVPSPAAIRGGRIYVSLGSPMYIPVSPDDQGWGGPDLRNPADPNADVYYDWYEYTYVSGEVAFGGNTTQVDQFGFPMTARLQQPSSGYDTTQGITRTRAEVMSGYAAAVGAAFRPLQSTYRITAPRSASAFLPGGAQASYLQAAVDQAWTYYTGHQFTLTRLGETFTGRVSGSTLTFTKNGAGPFTLAKPTSSDVFACAGALASGSDVEKQLGAEFCAALNRGVALDPASWYTPSAYYTGAAKNDYAAYFHGVGLNGRSYAFPYDDVNDRSTVQILGNARPPAALTLGIGW